LRRKRATHRVVQKCSTTSTQNASVWSLIAAVRSDIVFVRCVQIRLLTYLLTYFRHKSHQKLAIGEFQMCTLSMIIMNDDYKYA